MTDIFRLDGKVAVVTGASSGLGERIALALAGAGAKVAVAARRIELLEALVARLPGQGHIAVRCDLERPSDIEALVQAVVARHAAIHVLVNNAGYHKPKPVEQESLEDYERTLGLNLKAPFLLCKLAAAHMIAQDGGSIVNVASVGALVGNEKVPSATYTASKGGLVAMTRDLAAQWAKKGVRVNAICPGWFKTDITASMFESEKGRAFVARQMPMARPGLLPEIDGAVLFLASGASSYVTGVAIPIDGGLTAV